MSFFGSRTSGRVAAAGHCFRQSLRIAFKGAQVMPKASRVSIISFMLLLLPAYLSPALVAQQRIII